MKKARGTSFFHRNGVTSFFLVATLLVGLAAFAWGVAIHKEASAIKADGGYYAVSESINEHGLPGVYKKNP